MKQVYIVGALLAGCLFSTPMAAQTLADWEAELPRLLATIKAVHPDPFTKIGEREFTRSLSHLQARLGALSEEQRIAETMRLVASIGDGHSWVEPYGDTVALWYPIRFYEFSDGLFVTSAHKRVPELAGAQIIEIGGRPPAVAVESARALLGADNRFGELENLHALSNAGLMKALGLTDASGLLPLRIKRRDGTVVNLRLSPQRGRATFDWKYRSEPFGLRIGETEDWIAAFRNQPAVSFRDAHDNTRPLHLRNRNYYHASALPAQDAYYIQVNFVANNEDEPLLPFFRRAMREVDQLKPKRLIVDWRYNSGGDGSTAVPMIHEFIKREDNRPWQELYILTGRKTFSAAIIAVDAFREHTVATFIGEPPGAPLNHFGDATEIRFPRIKLALHLSTSWHALTNAWEMDLNSPYVPVDVPAPFSFADYSAGKDPALDGILNGEEMRSLPVIIMTDGAVAARAVFEQRKRRFSRYGWWKAADRRAMSKVFYALLEQKKLDEALLTAQMNVEIHPELWSSWGNLGEAYLALGNRAEAINAYRRSMALDPHNEAVRSSGLEELN